MADEKTDFEKAKEHVQSMTPEERAEFADDLDIAAGVALQFGIPCFPVPEVIKEFIKDGNM